MEPDNIIFLSPLIFKARSSYVTSVAKEIKQEAKRTTESSKIFVYVAMAAPKVETNVEKIIRSDLYL